MNSTVLKLFSENVSINTSDVMVMRSGEDKYVGSSSECALLQMIPELFF
jgi:hypothetical protein